MLKLGCYKLRFRLSKISSGFLILFLCSFTFARDSVYSRSEVKVDGTPYSIYEVGIPRFHIAESKRPGWLAHFADAATLRQNAYNFAVTEYTFIGFLPKDPSPEILADLEAIKTGDCSILMITEFGNPEVVHQLAIVAYGSELPVEVRLRKRIPHFAGLEREPEGLRHDPIVYREPWGAMTDFDAISILVSSRPYIGGEAVEVQRLIHWHESKIDWIPVTHARLSANFTLWGALPISEKYKNYRPSSAEVERYIEMQISRIYEAVSPRDLDHYLDKIRRYALAPPTQRTRAIDRIYIEAVGESRARMYANPQMYGFRRTPHSFEDPDFTGSQVHVLTVSRSEWDFRNAEIFSKRPGFEIVASEKVERTALVGPSGRSTSCGDQFNQFGNQVGPFLGTRGTVVGVSRL